MNTISKLFLIVVMGCVVSEYAAEQVHVMPDATQLKQLELCPAFKDTIPVYGYKEIISALNYADPIFNNKPITECSLNYITKSGKDVVLMQLRTVRGGQDSRLGITWEEPILAIRNVAIINEYAKNGDVNGLKKLYNVQDAVRFLEEAFWGWNAYNQQLLRQHIELTMPTGSIIKEFVPYKEEKLSPFEKEVRKGLLQLSKDKTLDEKRFSFVPDITYINKNADTSALSENERSTIDAMHNELKNGLAQSNFYYTWIVGNRDEKFKGIVEHWYAIDAGETGKSYSQGYVNEHVYTVTLIKVDDRMEYIVLDPTDHYHLAPNSYYLERLKQLVEYVSGY